MGRTKTAVAGRKRHKKFLKYAKGYRGARSKLYRTARGAVERAMLYAYRDRKVKKRDFRRLWIIRINAGARKHGLSYSAFISGLRKAGVEIDRKILADIAENDGRAFEELSNIAKERINAS